MKKLETIRIDWEKRFKNLYVSTSAIKNFIRLDWTKKSQERKERYNKEVKYVIDLAAALTEDYNKLTEIINSLNYDYEQMYGVVSGRISEALNDKSSVESRLDVLSKGIKTMNDTIEKAYKKFSRIDININNCKYCFVKSSAGMNYSYSINEYSKKIRDLREMRKCEVDKINELQGELKAKKSKLYPLEVYMVITNFNNDSDTTKKSKLAEIESEVTDMANRSKEDYKDENENALRNLYDDILAQGNSQIKNALDSIRKKVDQAESRIKEIREQYKNFETNIETISKQGNILSKANLIKFNNKVIKYFNEIKTLEKLIEIRDNKKSYGAGFFKFISTKETKLEKLKKKFYEIKSDLLKDYKQMEKYVGKIWKYQVSSADEGAKNNILVMLDNIENSFEISKLEINTHVFGFDEELRTIKIHAIMPFKSQNDGLIESVCEVEILFK